MDEIVYFWNCRSECDAGKVELPSRRPSVMAYVSTKIAAAYVSSKGRTMYGIGGCGSLY